MAVVKDLGVVTAYAYAVAGGYVGTEAEFTEALGRAGIVVAQLENLTAVATTLAEGAEATASYADGVLTFGIPRGATGEQGVQGEQGVKGDTGNGIESIAKTGTSGLVDTYTITFTDGSTTTFAVTNGADGDITNVAQAFDATKAYSVGDMVLYQGTLYAFTAAHAAGAWVGSDAQAVILADEVTALKDDFNQSGLTHKVLQDIGVPTENSYWNIQGAAAVLTSLTGDWIAWSPIQVAEGETWAVKAQQGSTHNTRKWVITDDNLNIITMSDDRPYNGLLEETFIVPKNGTKLLVTSNKANTILPYAWVYKVNTSNDNLVAVRFIDYGIVPDKYWNVETDKAVLTDIASTWGASTAIPVSPGDIFTVCANQYNTHKTRIWMVVDDDMNIIDMANDYYQMGVKCETIAIPNSATKLLVCSSIGSGSAIPIIVKYDVYSPTINPLNGKRLSILGDSISAYTGTIPSGYTPYYTGDNSGVWKPEQMWWYVLCEKTGMKPCVINAWSGSAITQLEDSAHSNITPMSDTTRCSALSNGDEKPDIIIIAGGVNDYTYAESAQSEPLEWNATSAPTDGASFTETYACMIKKIQTNYPNAVVVALSTWFTMRGSDNGYTFTHTVGNNVYTQADYNKAIKYVCEQMHIPYIDVSDIGFNRSNFYPTYANDSPSIPTHPNNVGQYVMGKAIAEKLPMLVCDFITT